MTPEAARGREDFGGEGRGKVLDATTLYSEIGSAKRGQRRSRHLKMGAEGRGGRKKKEAGHENTF